MQSSIVKEEFVVNWKRVLVAAFKRWWILVICFIIGGVAGFGAGAVFVTPTYDCQAVYLVSFSTGGTGISDMYSQWNLASKILQNCQEIAGLNAFSNKISDAINKGLSKDDANYLSPKYIAKCLRYTKSATGGTLITATVSSPKYDDCQRIVKGLTDNFDEYMSEKMKIDDDKSIIKFVLVNEPEIPDTPSAKFSKKLFAAIGAVAGVVLSYVVLCFVELADVKIKSETDIINKYNAPILGTIYDFAESEALKGGSYYYDYKA